MLMAEGSKLTVAPNDAECDARGDDSSTTAKYINKKGLIKKNDQAFV